MWLCVGGEFVVGYCWVDLVDLVVMVVVMGCGKGCIG